MSPGSQGEVAPAEPVAADLRAAIKGRVLANQPLAPFTSFRVGGPAAVLVEAEDEADLRVIGEVVAEHDLPVLVLGRGTNVLIGDGGFGGVVVRTGKGFEWIREGKEHELEAGGGLSLPVVANYAAKRCMSGMEFAVAIPATVGGAVRMNAGAHGSSVSEVLRSARIFRLAERIGEDLPVAALQMSYRRTTLGATDIVCSARFGLQPGSLGEIKARMDMHRKHRTRTQPSEAPNAGSMFKNPPGSSAGELIERAGLKGHRVGGAEVSGKHANFFLAHSGARAQDVYDLMAHVQSVVWDNFGVMLLPEVRIVGSFDKTAELKTA